MGRGKGGWYANSEGYPDSTAGIAIQKVSREERKIAMRRLVMDGTDPRRQIIGRRSKMSGETFERWLTNACKFYLLKGWLT